jgi:hypothetical protein
MSPPVAVAERSKACSVFALSEAGIVGSNPSQGRMFGMCMRFSVFVLSCVSVEALRQADHPSKESYRL